MKDTRVEAPKMFRDMDGMVLENVVLTDALECCWHCRNAKLRGVQAEHGDYLFMHGENIDVDGFRLNGNYSFQYCRNVVIRNAEIHSKDAFWNTEDVTVYDSVVDGEYLGWHSRNLRLVNCRISGTQALCYAENLVLENCTLGEDADLCFEYSSVHAEIKGRVHSVKIRAVAALLRKSTGILFWTSIARLLPIAPLKRESPIRRSRMKYDLILLFRAAARIPTSGIPCPGGYSAHVGGRHGFPYGSGGDGRHPEEGRARHFRLYTGSGFLL